MAIIMYLVMSDRFIAVNVIVMNLCAKEIDSNAKVTT